MHVTEMKNSIPPGFTRMPQGRVDDYLGIIGPYYLHRQGDEMELGFHVERRHSNYYDVCHGGMMASFCDMLLAFAVSCELNNTGEHTIKTISLQTDYIGAAPLGSWVQGKADVLRLTRSMAFVQGLVTADGTLVTRVNGIFKIGKRRPVAEVPA